MNTTQWFLQLAGEQRGPFPAWQLSRYLLLKRLHRNDMVSRDGTNWEEIGKVTELQPERRLSIIDLPEEEKQRLQTTMDWIKQHPDLFPKPTQVNDEGEGGSHLKLEPKKENSKLLAYGVVVLLLIAIAAIPSLLPSPPPVAEPQCDAVPSPSVNWSNCLMSSSMLAGRDLSGASLRNTNLNSSDLSGARLVGTDLSYSNLSLGNLSGALLTGAQLKGANLRNTDLTNANLKGADLSYADLSGAQLRGADLRGVRLGYAIWEENISCMPESVGKCIPARVKP